MKTIYLMRHGHVDNPDNVFYGPEFPLSDQGKQNIRLLVGDMQQAGVTPTRIVASPFVRAQETAAIAAEMFGIPSFRSDERLREWDVGPWFNKPLAQFYATTHYNQTPPRIDDPNVESLGHMADRMISVFDELLKEKDGPALIVSHREPVVSSLLRLQHLPWDGMHSVAFPRASVWEVSFNDNGTFNQARKRFDRNVSF